MKKRIFYLIIGLLLTAVNSYAGNGDLVVNGILFGYRGANPVAISGRGNNQDVWYQICDGTHLCGYWGQDYNNGNIVMGADITNKDQFVLSSNGKLGLGTVNPAAVLHISNPGYGYYGLLLDNAGVNTRTVRLFTEQGGGGAGIQISQNEANNNMTWQILTDASGNFDVIHPGAGASLLITPSGSVGIGTTPSYRFQVGSAGDGTMAVANGWYTFSDERWKKDFVPIDNALDKINHLNGYYYYWNQGPDAARKWG